MTSEPAGLPEGWRLDPECEHRPDIGVWWAIMPNGMRTAWNDPAFDNASLQACTICEGDPAKMPTCDACSGRGVIDHVPYCDRPWDRMIQITGHRGELWLGGIHCQFGGVASGPRRGQYRSVEGNCFPSDLFDVVLTLHHNSDYDPAPHVEHHVYTIADADLDPSHHTHLDCLAERVLTDVRKGKVILVRCQAGINRSALIAGLVLMKGWGLSADEAMAWMRMRRSPYVLFNQSFAAYLREVESRGARA